MTEVLTEVDGDVDADGFQLKPYGLLLVRLESGAMARKACDALQSHMERFRQSIVADDGLHFADGAVDLDFAIVTRAILWRDYTDPGLKAKAATDLEQAVDAARHAAWARRRADR